MEENHEQEQPRILYHGTTLGWAKEARNQYGHYKSGNLGGTHLTTSIVNALGYANQRAETYSDYPIMLVIDAKKIESTLQIENLTTYVVKALNIDAFLIYDPLSPNSLMAIAGVTSDKNLYWETGIKTLENLLRGHSKEEIPFMSYSIFQY